MLEWTLLTFDRSLIADLLAGPLLRPRGQANGLLHTRRVYAFGKASVGALRTHQRVDSPEKLASKKKFFESELSSPQKFKEIYKFAFFWCKNPEQKIIGLEYL